MNGTEIKTAREERGWTQVDLAQAVGVSVSTVSNWERGETVPKNRMGKLRKILGTETVGAASHTDQQDTDEADELRYRRPEGVSDQQWAQIRARSEAYLQGLIDQAASER